jgi:7-cyano-7-deazaguanine synthase
MLKNAQYDYRGLPRPMTRLTSATVLMSGGIDSAACAWFLKRQGMNVRGAFINYGQAAAGPERQAAVCVAGRLSITLDAFNVGAQQGFGAGELPYRNAFLIFTTLFLQRQQEGVLAIGVHAGTPYFDCSPAFVASIATLVSEHSDGRVTVVAPFLDWSKRDIITYCQQEGVPIQLTYSCEAGFEPPCGRCLSCRDRIALGC